MKRYLPYLLIAGGTLLAYNGALDLIQSYFGQTVAARTFVPSDTRPSHARSGDTVAELSIPRLKTRLYVLEGDDDQELRRGPGHMPGTAMPGAIGNAVIAGHRDTHFRVLKDIRKGDEILVRTADGEFRYQVRGTSIVEPEDTAALEPSTDTVLHLVTCYPFSWIGSAPKRFVVEASLEKPEWADGSLRRPM
ncbi:MAG TPA: class D sortase [Candidatus Acidoferrum sp.]|nr:class D sortase [Candidatus Acidoferrum sp.]